MTRTMEDSVAHRANRPRSLHVAPPRRSKPPSRYSNSLGHALLLCRRVVRSVNVPFLPHAAFVVLTGFLLRSLMASPLLFLLDLIRAFLLRKLHDALMFVLLISSIGFLGFLLDAILLNGCMSAQRNRPASQPIMNKRRRRKEKKKKKAEMSFFDSCPDEIISADFTTLLSKLLFESSDDSSLGSVESREHEAEDQFCESEAEGPSKQPTQAAAAHEEEEEAEAFCAYRAHHESEAATYYRSPLQTMKGSASSTNDTEVRQIQRSTHSNINKHSRSRSHNISELHDTAPSSSSSACAAEPYCTSWHRRESLSCDWGSAGSNFPWLQDARADLHAPPLPPFLLNDLKKGSKTSSESALNVLQSQLTPWRVISPDKSCDDKAAKTLKPPDIIDYSEVFGRSSGVSRAMGGTRG